MSIVLFVAYAIGLMLVSLFVAGLAFRGYQFYKYIKPEIPDCTFLEFLNKSGQHPKLKPYFIATFIKLDRSAARTLNSFHLPINAAMEAARYAREQEK